LLNNPEYGVLIGSAYLAYQLQRYKTLEKALVAYNQGNYSATSARKAAFYLAKYREREAQFGATVARLLAQNRQQPATPLAVMQPLRRDRNADIRTRRGILEFA
jgi:hypothetical protein